MNTPRFLSGVIVTIILWLFMPATGTGQINVVPFGSGKPAAEKDGIIYALPRNVLQIRIRVIKSESFKGPYADYASRLLGITDVIRENSTSFSIGDFVINSYAETDPEQFYFIEIDDKVKDPRSLMVSLSEEGFIRGFADISLHRDDVRDAVLTGDFSSDKLKPFRDLLKPVLIEKVDTVIRRISIDTTTIEEKVLKRSISEKTPEQQAREIADLIYRIEDNKFSLITGYQEVNYSRESLEYMIEQLNKMGDEYLALFKGHTRTSEEIYTYYVTPQSDNESMLETLCRFSKTKGISEKTGSAGESVSLIITPLKQNKSIEEFVKQREQIARKLHGFYYRIPEKALVTLKVGGVNVGEQQMLISQMGLITFLPAGNMSNVQFDHQTGAVIQAVSE